jgi:2-iminobutanoate/2-iminopropanoate deaminase
MMKKAIQSNEAPAAIGPYSQAIYSGGMIYVSGMLGIDPADGNLKATVTEQAEQALKNLSAVLKEAGTDMGSVVKTTVFITDMGAFGAVNEIYARYFTAPFPARSCVQVSALPKGGLFEIEAIAEV